MVGPLVLVGRGWWVCSLVLFGRGWSSSLGWSWLVGVFSSQVWSWSVGVSSSLVWSCLVGASSCHFWSWLVFAANLVSLVDAKCHVYHVTPRYCTTRPCVPSADCRPWQPLRSKSRDACRIICACMEHAHPFVSTICIMACPSPKDVPSGGY